MPLVMVQPTQHPKSGVYRLRLTIPPRLQETAHRLYGTSRELTVSLRTKDKRTAIAAAPEALGQLQAKLAAIEAAHAGRGRSLSHREAYAIAGEWYRRNVALHERDPGDVLGWEEYLDRLLEPVRHEPDEMPPDYEPDAQALAEATALLADQGVIADPASVRAVAVALWSAKGRLANLMIRRAQGDYGHVAGADSFPAFADMAMASSANSAASAPVTLSDLVRGWARDNGHNPDAKPMPRAFYDRYRTAERLADFLGHRDARRVTKAEAGRWKQAIQDAGRSPATVANDISEMSAVWKWGLAHGHVTDNPFAGLLPPKKARRRKAKRRPFSQDEAAVVLSAARQ